MKNICLSCAIALLCTHLLQTQLNSNNGLPNVMPPSLTAFEFLKYGEIPVSKYTGVPNISIPIYTIEAKGLNIPIPTVSALVKKPGGPVWDGPYRQAGVSYKSSMALMILVAIRIEISSISIKLQTLLREGVAQPGFSVHAPEQICRLLLMSLTFL